MNQIITTAIELVILIASFVIGKYIVPKLSNKDLTNLTVIADWAKKFVTAATAVLGDDATGEQKLEYVSKQLAQIAKDKGISITDDQIRAIIEDAYATYKEAMKSTDTDTKSTDSKDTKSDSTVTNTDTKEETK
jgi:LL-H family phage holin